MGKNSLEEKPPLVLFSLFNLHSGYKGWAFRQMGLAARHLSRQSGLRFGKLMGTGRGRGFSIRPNFKQYALLTSWKDEPAADDFLRNSSMFNNFRENSREVFTCHILPVAAKGEWHGQNPLLPLAPKPEVYQGPVLALTRATIRWQRLMEFWRHVPPVSKETTQAEGLLAQVGMGELPIIQQATFSIWKNEEYLQKFAYQMKQHQEVIRKTRNRNWYGEELFARFIPLQAEGSWDGKNPLAEYPLSK